MADNNSEPHEPGDVIPVLTSLMDVLEELAEAGKELAGQNLPAADSHAMAERAAGAQARDVDFEETVHAAHSNAAILRFAATDNVRQFTKMFRTAPVPVYAHLCVVRSALETAAVSHWLAEPGIGPDRRAQRYFLIRLDNAKQLERSPITSVRQDGKDLRSRVLADGHALGWNVVASRKMLSVDEQVMPTGGALIAELLAGGDPRLQRLGQTMWWFLSGILHGATYALMQSIEHSNPEASSLEPARASIFTSSTSVSLQGLVLGRAYRELIERHANFFGWQNTRWAAASQHFVEFCRHNLDELGPGGLQVA